MTIHVRLDHDDGRTVDLDVHAARVLLDTEGYDFHGYATEFDRCLAAAVLRADAENRDLLRRVYPKLVDAADVLHHAQDGLASLREAANEPDQDETAAPGPDPERGPDRQDPQEKPE